MAETDLLDTSFMFLYSRQKEPITYKSLDVHISNNEVNSVRLLNWIYSMGFLDREVNLQQKLSHNNNIYNYSINSKGIDFIETLPIEFKDTPYKYHLQLLENERIRQRAKEDLDRRQTESVITTNKLTWWNVGATILFGIIVTVTQLMTCARDKEKDIREVNKLNQDSLIQSSQSIHDSLLQNRAFQLLEGIRDSLSK